MYIPKHFEVTEQEEIFSFIQANGFGQLISTLKNRPYVTHLPLLLNTSKDKLLGHIAKQNPQHTELEGQEVLVTLQGPHNYISPSWYDSPGVPTWNYQAVHIYGKCRIFSDTNQLAELVNTLTSNYEANFEGPWQTNYPPAMLNAIIGLEITIEETQCKYKLGQNRSPQDRKQVASELNKQHSFSLASAIKQIDDQ